MEHLSQALPKQAMSYVQKKKKTKKFQDQCQVLPFKKKEAVSKWLGCRKETKKARIVLLRGKVLEWCLRDKGILKRNFGRRIVDRCGQKSGDLAKRRVMDIVIV